MIHPITQVEFARQEPKDELQRALRTATRSLEEAKSAVLLEDAHQQLADTVHQLTFVLQRLVDERAKI